MKTFIALILARLASFASRLSGRGSGSALPGLVVERIDPDFLAQSLSKIPQGVVLITGTNGKTTTTKMVVELLEMQGVRVLTNKSGSNFTRGILSMLVRHTSVSGNLPFDIAVLEMDEAYARIIAKQVPPKLVVALNVHRDQLDRYGELNTTAKMIGDAMQYARFAIVNADDPTLLATTKNLAPNGPTVGYFGAAPALLAQMPTDDELHGDRQETIKRPQTLVELTQYSSQKITISIDGKPHEASFHLPGIYNAVNAAAAIMTVIEVLPGQTQGALVTKLSKLKPAFGRGESFAVGETDITFGLVKNPSGFNHNLKTMIADASAVLIAVNDAYADGRDVSWLWDVHFAEHTTELQAKTVLVSGVRADDMVLRLDQDGIAAKKIESLESALDEAINVTGAGKLVVLPTYTAMLALRAALSKKTEVPDIW